MSQTPDLCEWEGCQRPPDKKLRFVGKVTEWVYYCTDHADLAQQFPYYDETESL